MQKGKKYFLKRLGLYLFIARKEAAGIFFILAFLPVFVLLLALSVHSPKHWYLGTSGAVIWLIWTIGQCKFVVRRRRLCAELIKEEELGDGARELLRRLMGFSAAELGLLLSLILSPSYFVLVFILRKDHRKLRREYEALAKGETGMDVENDLDRHYRSRSRRNGG